MCQVFLTYLSNEWFAINALGLSRWIGHELLRGRAHVSPISVPCSLIQGLVRSEHELMFIASWYSLKSRHLFFGADKP